MRGLPLLFLVACAAPSRVASLPDTILLASDGASVDLRHAAEGARATVIVFFSKDCHCLAVHDARLKDLAARYRERGVRFVMVDSETGASPDRDAREARERGYAYPILIDRGARLADALGAEYATYSVVLDDQGRVRYRGGIDSDRTHLHDDATPFLEIAIDDLLSGRDPRVPRGEALGCALRKW